MGTTHSASLTRYLPFVLLATAVVTLVPGLLVWVLAGEGVIESFVPLMLIGVAASLVISFLGRVVWQRHPASDDMIFADLMLWGWIRRFRIERRLGDAGAMLGLTGSESRAETQPARQIEALKDLAAALEARDPYTHGHSRRVARYSAMIAQRLGLGDDEVRKIRTAAAVHDVGKLELPLAVLNKPGKLSDDEFALIKSHAPLGAEMVKSLGDRELTEMVAHHHERLDGTGYPSRLSGEQIPLGARIIAVADTFDALTSTRAYRGAKRHKDALAVLHAEAGTQLDPHAVHAFDRCYAGSFGGLTVWALFASLPHRLWAPLESQVGVAQAAGGTVATKAITVAAATAATGTIALSPLADPRDTNTDDLTANLASSSALAGGGPAILRVVEEPLMAAAGAADEGGAAFAGSQKAGDLDPDVGNLARDPRAGNARPGTGSPTLISAGDPAPPAPPPADSSASTNRPLGDAGSGEAKSDEPASADPSDQDGGAFLGTDDLAELPSRSIGESEESPEVPAGGGNSGQGQGNSGQGQGNSGQGQGNSGQGQGNSGQGQGNSGQGQGNSGQGQGNSGQGQGNSGQGQGNSGQGQGNSGQGQGNSGQGQGNSGQGQGNSGQGQGNSGQGQGNSGQGQGNSGQGQGNSGQGQGNPGHGGGNPGHGGGNPGQGGGPPSGTPGQGGGPSGTPGQGGGPPSGNPGHGGGPPSGTPGQGGGPPSGTPGHGGGPSGTPGQGGGPPSGTPGQGGGPPSGTPGHGGGNPGQGGGPPSGNTGQGLGAGLAQTAQQTRTRSATQVDPNGSAGSAKARKPHPVDTAPVQSAPAPTPASAPAPAAAPAPAPEPAPAPAPEPAPAPAEPAPAPAPAPDVPEKLTDLPSPGQP